jgi:hypothetical protein
MHRNRDVIQVEQLHPSTIPPTRLSLRLRREYRRRRSRGGWGVPTNSTQAPSPRDLSLLPPPSFVGRRDQPRRKREDSRKREYLDTCRKGGAFPPTAPDLPAPEELAPGGRYHR